MKKRKKKKKNAKKEEEVLDQGEISDTNTNKLSFRVVNLQIKPDQKVNHHKTITEQKYLVDRLKLENLELQTT